MFEDQWFCSFYCTKAFSENKKKNSGNSMFFFNNKVCFVLLFTCSHRLCLCLVPTFAGGSETLVAF